jgi:hypothetical protein
VSRLSDPQHGSNDTDDTRDKDDAWLSGKDSDSPKHGANDQ